MKKPINFWYVIPLLVFIGLVAFMGLGLRHDPHEVPSPLINKSAPDFTLPQLGKSETFSPHDLLGQVWLLNVWASWCVSCRDEHPILLKFARDYSIPLIGLDYKDRPQDGEGWVTNYGNPYTKIAVDLDGRVGINYGVYGVPETYVIDKKGVIRYKQIGPITEDALKNTLLPLIKELQQ
ncbi:DsbE family thiol:disulfide interchange protein [Ferrovum sp. PN-J185]|uniref:DsbE family thiol:disulfide interchange protein n=1 Tax=Ferrovum sp. PN-J185 TaxID=1356306 RepID=UPI0007968581|nr:DsbE family thiol:disulfide interchange protein [Ferrovum sp. PN-J185]KXW55240.1 thiol:disulfide interchange protein CycY precursor [Ferrovum sp. PN-J185]MCC6068055.1 DsbE family thiol:disulfide interchange protein [Ferrovum sp. PN-J185]